MPLWLCHLPVSVSSDGQRISKTCICYRKNLLFFVVVAKTTQIPFNLAPFFKKKKGKSLIAFNLLYVYKQASNVIVRYKRACVWAYVCARACLWGQGLSTHWLSPRVTFFASPPYTIQSFFRRTVLKSAHDVKVKYKSSSSVFSELLVFLVSIRPQGTEVLDN